MIWLGEDGEDEIQTFYITHFIFSIKVFDAVKDVIERIKYSYDILSHYGFNIIEDYDYKSDINCLKDEEDKIICPICYDEIDQEKITVVQCVSCKKYIGHIACIVKLIISARNDNVLCPMCRYHY